MLVALLGVSRRVSRSLLGVSGCVGCATRLLFDHISGCVALPGEVVQGPRVWPRYDMPRYGWTR